MNCRLYAGFAASLLAAAGCQTHLQAPPVGLLAEPTPYVTLDELSGALSYDDSLVLVEFCVPVSCSRCSTMRDSIDQLASERRGRLTVRRVDLRQHPQLTWEFELATCPSYIVFRDGEEVFRASYPTSVDIIAAA
ncbi:MAG: thioredoxin family protein, partial [Planctomycetota bacterium]